GAAGNRPRADSRPARESSRPRRAGCGDRDNRARIGACSGSRPGDYRPRSPGERPPTGNSSWRATRLLLAVSIWPLLALGHHARPGKSRSNSIECRTRSVDRMRGSNVFGGGRWRCRKSADTSAFVQAPGALTSAANEKRPARTPAFMDSFRTTVGRSLRRRRRQRQRLGFRRGRHDRRLLLALVQDQLVALDRDLADLGHRGAGASRDEPADNDVLLEAFQRVDLAVDGGLGEHAGGLLERRRREEGAGLQARLGDAEQNRRPRGGLLALLLGLGVDLVELDLVDLLARDHVGLALVGDFDLLQHLTDNHLDVLVVDEHALQPVDLLDLVDQIGREFLDALDRQDVVRCRVAFDDEIALFDDIAVLQMDVLALRDQVLAGLLGLVHRLDRDAALVLVVAAEADRARNLRDDRRVLWLASLEQFRHPRQTAGDIARLGAFG